MESRKAQQAADESRNFNEANDFLSFYEKSIKNALGNKDKSALKDLFCKTVIDNTADMDDGLEYIVNLEDWSIFSGGASNCSSLRQFGGGFCWKYFMAHADMRSDNTRYRMFFEGYGWYKKTNSDSVTENVGLTKLYICRLDDDGKIEGLHSFEINGIYHPGRESLEMNIDIILNKSSAKNDVEAVLSPELLNSADTEQLEDFFEFSGLDPKIKKNAIFFFLEEQDGGYTVSSVIYSKWGDKCISLLIRDGMISGAVLSEDENMKKPDAGELKGFEIVTD